MPVEAAVEFSYGVSIISFWFSPGLNPVFYELAKSSKADIQWIMLKKEHNSPLPQSRGF